MMKLFFNFFIIIFFFICISCHHKEDVESVYPELEGEWSAGGGYSLSFEKDGDGKTRVVYQKCEPYITGLSQCDVFADGKGFIRNGKFRIGGLINGVSYDIGVGPYYQNGYYYLNFDNKIFVRKDHSPNCFDNIKNQDEIHTDCGGVCAPCAPSCYDNIQNQNEKGIDCGGPCNKACFSSFTYTLQNMILGPGPQAEIVDSLETTYSSTNSLFTITCYSKKTFTATVFLSFSASGTGTFSMNASSYVRQYSLGDDCYMNFGSITITSFDQINKRISGTFYMSGTCPNGSGGIGVMNGAFSNVTY